MRNHQHQKQEKAENPLTTLLKIWNYLSKQRSRILWILVCTVVTSGLTLAAPYLMGKIIDDYIISRNLNGLIIMASVLLAVYVFSSLFSWLQLHISAKLSQLTVRDMRKDLFEKYQQLPMRFFDQRTHGELMSRITNDIENVSNTLNQTLIQVFSSILMLAGSIVLMVSLSIRMTLITITIIPVILFITKWITKYTRQYFAEQQTYLGEVNGYVQENISGLKTVRTFSMEQESIAAFSSRNENLRSVGVKAQSLSGSLGPLMNATRNLSFLIIALAGSYLAYQDIITIGIIVSFLSYSNQFSQPINQLANQYNLLQSAIAGAERVFEVLKLKSEKLNDEDGLKLEEMQGEVVFDSVNFRYNEDRPTLKDISLHALPGQTVALIGPTGAGKSTIINLLTRFYDIDSGSILLDGNDIRSLHPKSLRDNISLVLQNPYIFSGTIKENIRYGKLDATDEEIETAARIANADAFISQLPNQYDTYLDANGSNLSQGQKQLLTIARAVIANPAVLILDEATSSIDTKTEQLIQKALDNVMQNRTSFVIAHRLSTIRNADQILVIEDGSVKESGSHTELLGKKGLYAELYHSQSL